MLDFYSISDEDDSWHEPREECYVGSLALKECEALSDLWPTLDRLGIHLSFFEDSRVRSKEVVVAVEQIHEFLATGLPSEASVRMAAENASYKIRQILEKSAAQGKGIIAFCD